MQRSDYPNHVISSTGAAQEWWSFTFFVRRPLKVFVFAQWCMPRTAQCTLPSQIPLSQLPWTKRSKLPVSDGWSDAAGECQNVICKRLQIMDTGNSRPAMKNKNTLFTKSKSYKQSMNTNSWYKRSFSYWSWKYSSLGKCCGFDILECI